MLERVKLAVKCLLGRPIQAQKTMPHDYHLVIDDITKFEGYYVLVTGGTGAIGSAICYELAAMGASVGMCGRTEDKIKKTIDSIGKRSSSVADKLIPVVLDVNDDEMVDKVLRDFASSRGRIDVFVNNAGGQPGRVGKFSKHLFEQSIEQIDLILDTNLRGVILCSRIASEIMAKQRSGHIISMASVIGINGKAGYCDYAATKAAIIGFTRSLAVEMSEYNVRVNCISPGSVNQVPFDGGSEPSPSSLNPMHRSGYTREIADTVAFLMSNEFITGENIVVDGGRSLGLYGDN